MGKDSSKPLTNGAKRGIIPVAGIIIDEDGVNKALNIEDIINSGGISGALDPSSDEAIAHASMMYEEIRHRTTDAVKIAQNTGWDETVIAEIKSHMFYNEYNLRGTMQKFDPDFDQAQAWDRLTQGKQSDVDIVLLNHEITELRLMRDFGYSYDEAHKKANEKFNWQQIIDRR
ncbi:hypothetical protein FACS1894105_08860 [Clostridia bacterium]|nr:hypothetical protein FACS1894105_08860 [Clostridia bacterium]